jgi:DNA-binding LacI/PurR family transcriptional regulator
LCFKPVVVLVYEGQNEDIDFVLTDSRNDTRKAVQFLIGLGHQRIGCVYGRAAADLEIRPSLQNRIRAYRETLADHNLPGKDSWVIRMDGVTGDKQFREVMAGPQPPTALFCTTAFVALRVYEAARLMGTRIPEDLSLVGYDDLKECEHASPGLTTVQLPLFALGNAAVMRVMEKQEESKNSTVTHRTTSLPGKLVLRGSHQKLQAQKPVTA